MGTEKSVRERGAWTPFVGGALAALTAGSLIVFSLVAQKTSLEGFSSRGVTAISPSVSAPRSITLPGGATDAAVDAGSLTPSEEAGSTALSTLTPTSVASVGSDPAVAPNTTTTTRGDGSDDTQVAVAPNSNDARDGTFSARLAGGGAGPDLFRLEPDAQADDDRAKGKSKKATKAKKSKNDKSKKKAKRGKNESHRGGRAHGRAGANKQRGHSGSAVSRSHGRSGSGRPAPPSRPQHSSRPAPRPQPQQASKPKPKPAPPGHTKSNGNGHSKDRGRGHAKH